MSKLWDALELISKRDMLKGDRGLSGGAHCALGFLDEAHGALWFSAAPKDWSADVEIVATVANEQFPERCNPNFDPFNGWARDRVTPSSVVAAFNNHPDTTKTDLALVFEKAAIQTDEIL